MGNTNTTHTMARLGKLGSAMQEVKIEKEPDEKLGLNMKSLVVVSIDDPSAAQRHGCGAIIGMRLVSVNGTFVQSAAEVREQVYAQSQLMLRFIPKELPLVIERRSDEEPLGLTLTDDAVLSGVQENTCGMRSKADQYIGLRVVSVCGAPITTLADVEERARGEKMVLMGFAIPLPDNTPDATAATLARRASRQGSLTGSQFMGMSQSRRSSMRSMAGDGESPTVSPRAHIEHRRPSAVQITRRRSSLTPLLLPAPKLSVLSPNRWQHCNGTYSAKGQPLTNGYRLWKREADSDAASAGERWLYSTPNGFWRITDSELDFPKGAGYIISREKHGGRMPHEMPVWQTKGYTDDPDIKITSQYAPEDMYEYAPPPLTLEVGMRVRVVSGCNIGRGGEVTEVREEGRRGVVNSHMDIEADRVYCEKDHEVALIRPKDAAAANIPIGLTFSTDGDLYLKSVVPGTPAELFGLAQYTSRRLVAVNNEVVHSSTDVMTAIANTTKESELLLLRFAPSETVSECPHLVLLTETEDLERRGKQNRRDLELLFVAQDAFAAAFLLAELWYTSWHTAKQTIQTVIRKCIEDGAGEAGCQEALAKFEPEQERIVRNIAHALTAAQRSVDSGAMLRSPAKETYFEIRDSVAAYAKAVETSAPVIASLHTTQARVDELDELAYKQRRGLVRNPKDDELKQSLQTTEGDLVQCETTLSTLVHRLEDIVDVLPQLYAYILPFNQRRKGKLAEAS